VSLNPELPPLPFPPLTVAASTSVVVGTTVELVRVPTTVLPSDTVVNVVRISWVAEVEMRVREAELLDVMTEVRVVMVEPSELVGVNVEVDRMVEIERDVGVTVIVVSSLVGGPDDVSPLELEDVGVLDVEFPLS
jgi:hypothetical protein